MNWVFITFLWFLGSLLWYVTFDHFTLIQSLRYVIDVGLGVGMGNSNLAMQHTDLAYAMSALIMFCGAIVLNAWWMGIVHYALKSKRKSADNILANIPHRPWLYPMLWSILWLCAGTFVIGMWIEQWSFWKSLNFAVGCFTTTGSISVSDRDITNALGALYILMGVPLFSVSITTFIADNIRIKDPIITMDTTALADRLFGEKGTEDSEFTKVFVALMLEEGAITLKQYKRIYEQFKN